MLKVEYKEISSKQLDEIKLIYKDVSWNAYLKDDEKLIRAYNNSLLSLGAFVENKLVGLIRLVGDGEHIVVIQDLAVLSSFQQNGIGTNLMNIILEKYKNVRSIQVVTDLEDVVDKKFYPMFGFKKLVEGHMVSYYK